jgi:protein-S-isoprenylcysteine O-methyltransferase Ste14
VAWWGAAAFVASLLWFIYSYLVRYGLNPASDHAVGVVVVDVTLFSIFALHHSLFAREALKRRVQQLVPPYLERSLYTWISSLLFLIVCTAWRPVPGVAYEVTGPWQVAGFALQLAGIGLTIKASSALDMLDLAGVRPVLAARRLDPVVHVPLETTGVYAFVRHPLYFGWALFVFGSPRMTATRAVFAIVSTAYLMLAVPWEERGLIRTFGKDYEAYQRKVRWRMLPGVY